MNTLDRDRLLAALDLVVLVATEDSDEIFTLSGIASEWSLPLWPALATMPTVRIAEGKPFVENFLVDARAHWAAGATELLQSGPWSESGGDGASTDLEAYALCVGSCRVLLFERLGTQFNEQRALFQEMRDTKLHLAHERREHADIAARLRLSADSADAASRTKSEFLATMSHELRTPLNSVIGFANIVLKNKHGGQAPQDRVYLQRVRDNAMHLLGLVNNILDLSKIEAGRVDPDCQPTRVGDLAHDVAAQFEPMARAKHVALTLEVPPALAMLETDASMLRQILLNLIANALRFTHHGAVTVRVLAATPGARPDAIEVEDTGIGIPADRLEAIFDPFAQADQRTSREYGGTGLGLAICRSLCHLLDYRITVESEVGRGSLFRVQFATGEPDPQPRTAGG